MMYWVSSGPAGGLRFYKENIDINNTATEVNKFERQELWKAYSKTPFGVSFFPKEVFQFIPE
jgi:hypothetical protein